MNVTYQGKAFPAALARLCRERIFVHLFRSWMVVVLTVSVIGCTVSADEEQPIASDIYETVAKVPVDEGMHSRDIVATTYMPAGPGPFPLIVLSHGSPPDPRDRWKVGRYRKLAQIRTFIRLGFAVVVPIRRGYGATGGAYEEDAGSCQHPDYTTAGKHAAHDVLAAVKYAQTLPQVDRKHVVLVGQSAGGFASLAAASYAPEGLVAVVNFSGGRGGNPSKHPGMPCGAQQMTDTIAHFAATIRVPVLWHYVQNDQFFAPEVVAEWYAAFRAAGGQGQLIIEPPFRANGHGMFAVASAIPIWLPHFEQFVMPLASKNRPTSIDRHD
ncbi:alpha/beta hydrolase family protein [Burkholderia territorii]|uniref:Alpha/beta fold hydrolase n=1 Tax=Burkholderia territorii TaxID=1503055 RepID=A0A6L3NKW9_9BURK|nr:alpha/beta fold hydrolase [Burkholderia territorii]KAB0685195.1 alpha/beta fold hydrolase [Burkholderia territorii]MBM2772025.1 alpha/beta fold hydrolase [Burkholderia territorii]VWB80107.1 dienelactone hydrolase-like protein [Burkholderia territorii]